MEGRSESMKSAEFGWVVLQQIKIKAKFRKFASLPVLEETMQEHGLGKRKLNVSDDSQVRKISLTPFQEYSPDLVQRRTSCILVVVRESFHFKCGLCHTGTIYVWLYHKFNSIQFNWAWPWNKWVFRLRNEKEILHSFCLCHSFVWTELLPSSIEHVSLWFGLERFCYSWPE